MTMNEGVPPGTCSALKWTALVVLDVLVVAAIGTAALRWPAPPVPDGAAGAGGPEDGHWWHRSAAECVVRPPVLTAAEATLDGHEEVIGVEVGGRARAYWLDAFRFPSRHIVNDLIAGVPISVTHCDIRDCTRVYTAPAGAAPLGITQSGLRDGRMVVRVGGVLYDHESGRSLDAGTDRTTFPFDPLPVTRMTWAEWRRLHPGTDLYVGPRDDDRPPARSGDGRNPEAERP
jgi:hypothetical protein